MTRHEFDAIYIELYPIMARIIARRFEDGHDALQSVYLEVIECKSYVMVKSREGREWLKTMAWKRSFKQWRSGQRLVQLKDDE
jgi:DNA-directed RNA polymerase specialized sigma24 family protein